MIGDVNVNNLKIWTFDELLTFLFVLFCVKKNIKLEFSLWSNTTAKEKGYFITYEKEGESLINKYFINTKFLDVNFEDDFKAANYMFDYEHFYNTVVGMSKTDLMELYPTLFDKLCGLYLNQRSKGIGPWQPVGLSKFVCSLLSGNNCKSIYNPFSGLCSYSILMDKDVYYRGQERDFETFQIAQLRLDAYDKANSAVYNEDVVSKLGEHFDAVVATLPFGGSFVDDSDKNKKRTYSDFYFSRSLESDANLYIGVVQSNFLFDEKHKYLRKELCERRIVEAIISLPGGVFYPQSGVQSAIVILRPTGGCNGVVFIEADDCFDPDKHEINDERLQLKINEAKHNPYKIIPIKDIEIMDYDLTPAGYQVLCVDDKVSIKETVKIGHFVRREEAENDVCAEEDNNTRKNVLDDSDFSDNLLRLSSYKDVDRETETTIDYQKIFGRHLVITKRKNELLCYFHKGNTSFYVAPYHLVFEIDEKIINPYLLAYYLLYHPVVKRYALSLFNGNLKDISIFRTQEILEKLNSSVRLKIAGKDINKFLNLRLGLGDLESQNNFVNLFLSQQKQLREREIQAERDRWGIRETTSDIVHMLGRPFAKQQNIIGFLKTHQPMDSGYADAVVALADVSNYIRRLVTSVGGDFSKYDYKKENVSLSAFIKEYVRSWNNFFVNDFDLEVEDHIDNSTIVTIDKDTMMILLDAAMDNAWRHGFKKLKKDGNKVCISLSAVDWDGKLYVDMQIGNNGTVIEQGINNEVFISKGRFSKETGRTGLGGNHIYQIAKKHDGFLSVSGGGKWNFCIDVLLPIQIYEENLSFEPVSLKYLFV